MHKNTLADIVIKAVRFANSVIDSSYEFPDVNMNVSEELELRDNVRSYCHACHDDSKKEERERHAKGILEYAASVQANEEYGKRLPGRIKTARTARIGAWISLGTAYAGFITSLIIPYGLPFLGMSIWGSVLFRKSRFNDAVLQFRLGMPLEKKLANENYDYSLAEDTAKELKAVAQKEFNEAIYEHWDELITALDDVSEQEKKRLFGKKRWE